MADTEALHVSTLDEHYENAHITATVTANFGYQGRQIDFHVTSQENFMPGSVNPVSAVTGPGGGVTTTYTSGDDVGPICITARDRNDLDASASCWVTVLRVDGGELWWFGGPAPENFPVKNCLLAAATTTGTFHWLVVEGYEHAGLGTAAVEELTVTGLNGVQMTARSASHAERDVGVHCDWNGIPIVRYVSEVRAPYRAVPLAVWHENLGSLELQGFSSWVAYSTVDQLGTELPHRTIPLNEYWIPPLHVSVWNGENWPGPPEHPAGSLAYAEPWQWADHIEMPPDEAWFPPPRWPLPDPESMTEEVDSIGQRWYMGSIVSGNGMAVQDDRILRYQNRGIHIDIVTPSPAWERGG